MDDLVKRLRELASIPEHCENVADCDQCSKEEICLSFTNERIIETATKAADAIDAMLFVVRAQKAALDKSPRWIPVTERLPGAGEIVLVYGKRGGIYTAEHNRNAMWPGSFWKLNSKSHYCNPTHWMPLPEPPSEEDKDG